MSMGLDIAETLLDLEAEFGVPFEWSTRLRTVGDLQQAFADAVTRALTMTELQAREHYTNEITTALGISASEVDRPILDAVKDLPSRLPDICTASWWPVTGQMGRPRAVVIVLIAITPVSMISLWLASPNDHSVVVAGAIFGPMVTALLAYLTDRWRTRAPGLKDLTPRMLVERAVQRFCSNNRDGFQKWTQNGAVLRMEIEAKVVEVVASRGGLTEARIRPTDRLVEDIGLG